MDVGRWQRQDLDAELGVVADELRRAFVHYRALFAELLDEPDDGRLRQAR